MEIIYLLIPISLILLGGIVWVLLWAVRDGQYDDLEGPAHRCRLNTLLCIKSRSQGQILGIFPGPVIDADQVIYQYGQTDREN
jgi:cbb3-type cytochrome oxidase maturation protein